MKTKINYFVLILASLLWLSLWWVADASVEVINAPWATYYWAQMQWLKFEDNSWHVIMMLDRNLWAYTTWAWSSAVGNSYGFYYQWWNNYGFPTNWDLTNVSTSQMNVSSYWPSNPYNVPVFVVWFDNWATSNDSTNLWWWEADNKNSDWWKNMSKDSAKFRQWPCPAWYHVPSAGEWNDLLKYWVADYKTQWNNLNLQTNSESDLNYFLSNSAAVEAFYRDFYIPYAGARSFQNLSMPNYTKWFLYWQGEWSALWTSSPSNSWNSQSFFLNTNGIKWDNKNPRAMANPVRCFFNPQTIVHRSNTNVTYVDTNWKEFTWIWTITFNDGEHEITILDRNLWAEKAWRNQDSYWYYFQWWNNYGFKPCNSNNCSYFPWWETTSFDQVDVSWYGWDNPYVSSGFVINYDWKWNVWDSNLWNENDESKRQWPCPAWYHVPTLNEWNDLVRYVLATYTWNWFATDGIIDEISQWQWWYWVLAFWRAGVFSDDLLIPYAGWRNRAWSMYDMWGWSVLLSSSVFGDNWVYNFKSANDWFGTSFYDGVYSNAIPLRCFKDTYTEENKPLILEYETNWWTKIQSQTIPSWGKGFLPWYTTHKNWTVFEWWYDANYETENELDPSNPYQFTNLIMNENLADENGVVKIYAKWQDVVSYNTGDITYVDTNWKEFTWIWTITFNDGEHVITILDRNLWAEKAWRDTDSYWYQFQWWNNYGFKACTYNGCRDFPWWESIFNGQIDASWYGWNNPYVSSKFVTNNGWIWDSSNSSLWNESDESKRQWPCPAGYHIPTVNERNDLVKYLLRSYTWDWFVIDGNISQTPNAEWFYWVVARWQANIISDDLLIPYAGWRKNWWELYDMWGWSVLWSSSIIGGAKVHVFKSANDWFWLTFDDEYSNASSIRCFKDTYTEENKPLILEYETNWWTKIQSQTILSWEKGFLPWYTTHKDWFILEWWYDANYQTKYELDSDNPHQFTDLVMNGDLADENGVVKVYAKRHKFISHDAEANVTYIDTNWKEFTWIWTITFDDGEHRITILDRNLWAEKAWTWLWDETWNNVFDWYHFQWWNNYWFKACRDYGCTNDFPWWETTTNVQVDASWYSWNNPYVSSWFITNNDWRWDTANSELRNEMDQSKRQWPCPAWYHIPTINEWNDLVKYRVSVYTWNWWTFPSWWWVFQEGEVNGDALYWFKWDQEYIRNHFNVWFAWFRNKMWSMQDKWAWAVFWSATPVNFTDIYTFKIWYGWYWVTYMDYVHISHADATSIRCFKDTYTEWNEPYILSYETNWWTKIQSQTIPSWNKWFLPWYSTLKSWAELLWWFNEDGTQQYEFETDKNTFSNLVINADTKIYAKWWYKVTFLNRSGDEIETKMVVEWDKAEAPELQTQTWYAMMWYDENWNFFDIKNNPITWDITLKGKEELAVYTITFDTDWWSEIAPITWYYDSDVSKPSDPTRDWYTFKWWDKAIPDKMPAEDMTIKAVWSKNGGWWGSWWWGGWWSSSSNKSEENTWAVTTWSLIDTGSDSDVQSGDSDIGGSKNNNGTEGNWYSKEFNDAYQFAYKNWITTKSTIEDANMTWKLTRIAMAKMLSKYAINLLWMKPDEARNNKFNDVSDKLDSDYDNWVTLAYQLWIMWINMPNNNFRPNDEVTRAEFVTALSRMLYNTSDGEYKSTPKYYVNHMEKLRAEWIITNDDPNMKELRGYVMIMLMRSQLD